MTHLNHGPCVSAAELNDTKRQLANAVEMVTKAERERDERRAAQSHALKLIELRTQERDACVRMLRQAVQICDTTNHDFPDWEDEARRLLESLLPSSEASK